MTILCEPDPFVVAALTPRLGGEAAVRPMPDLTAAALSIEAGEGGDVVVIGPDAPLTDVLQFSEHLLAERPDFAVILLRHDDELAVADLAIAAGVREVVLADDPDALAGAYERVHAREAERAPSGKVVTVFAPKGGSGKTTVSTNLAVALAKQGSRVCLVDLDLEFGDVAISLSLTPVRTLVDAVTNTMARDETELVQLLVTPFRDLVDCVLAPIEPGDAEKIPAEVVTNLLAALRHQYEFVVVDTPSQFSEHVLAALDMSDHYVLLTNPELPSVKNLRLTLDMFDLLGYRHDCRSVVFNRADSAAGLTAADVERALRNPITVQVPASRDVPASINKGVPIVLAKPDHPVSAAIRGFATSVLNVDSRVAAPRRSRLLRRRAR